MGSPGLAILFTDRIISYGYRDPVNIPANPSPICIAEPHRKFINNDAIKFRPEPMANDSLPGTTDNGSSVFNGVPVVAQDHYRQASELLMMGKTEDALHRFKQAVEIAPTFIHALHEIGNCLNILGRQEEASRYYARALDAIGDRLCEIGRQEESAGHYWGAIGRYQEASKFFNADLSTGPYIQATMHPRDSGYQKNTGNRRKPE